jgi:hypothetical protein
VSVTNVPYGAGHDEVSTTIFASELAKLCDALNVQASYVVDSYSPFSADEIAAIWSAPDDPTPEQLQKANDFKGWIATVNTMIDAAMAGDVGFQIKKWRNTSPYPR